MGLTLMAVPALLDTAENPVHMMQTWKGIYNRGKVQGPSTALLTLLSYGTAAYLARQQGLPWAGFVGAGLLTLGIMPFTIAFLAPTNSRLLAGAAGVGKGDVSLQTAVGWLRYWGQVNLVRGLLPLAGATLGLWMLVRTASSHTAAAGSTVGGKIHVA